MSSSPRRPPGVFTEQARRSSRDKVDGDARPMDTDDEIRTFKVKYLQVCDGIRWGAERVARALGGDTRCLAPTIMQATTHPTTAQAVHAVDMAIHPRLRVHFDAPKRVFRVCMPAVKKLGLNSRRKQEARAAPAGPAPPRAPPPSRSETHWRPTLRPAAPQKPPRLWSGAVSGPSPPPISVSPTGPDNLMVLKPNAGPG